MNDHDRVGQHVILRAADLTRTIITAERETTIIDQFSFDFEKGKIYTIVGPSGAGKSSLLRLFNRLDEKTGGEALFRGKPVEEYAVTDLRRRIALVFQEPYLFPGTVADNLAFCCDDKNPVDDQFASHYLRLVGLDATLAVRTPDKLSVGQKQRVALARSLVQEPDILLLDEPTSALDPGAARTIEELIVNLNAELGLTIIMVTHNFKQALSLEGISLVLINGRLVESGLSSDIFEHPGHYLTRRFVNGELR
jgi:putative ABC transport system ATP-binding protein